MCRGKGGAPVLRSGSHTPRAYPGRGTRAEGPLGPAHDPRRRRDQKTPREARERAEPGRRSAGRSASPGLPRAPAPRIRRRHRMFFRSGPPAPALTFSPLPSSTPPRPAPAPCLTPSRPRPGRAASLGCPGRRRTAPGGAARTVSRMQGAMGSQGQACSLQTSVRSPREVLGDPGLQFPDSQPFHPG